MLTTPTNCNINKTVSTNIIGNVGVNCHPLQTGSVQSVSNGSQSGPSSQSVSSKQTVMYSPFDNMDMIDQALGNNLIRDKNKKPLLPLIAKDDIAKNNLLQWQDGKEKDLRKKADPVIKLYNSIKTTVENYLGKNLTRDDFFLELEKIKGTSDADRLRSGLSGAELFNHQADVLKNMEIRSNQGGSELSKLSQESDTLSILGHGGAGKNILGADPYLQQGKITSSDLAKELIDGGLDKTHRHVKTYACYGADTKEPTSWKKDNLKQSSKPETHKDGFLGLFGNTVVDKEPFAQSLANDLYKLGIKDVEVAGYHGAGVTYSQIGHHSRRLPNRDVLDIQAKNVKQVFKPV